MLHTSSSASSTIWVLLLFFQLIYMLLSWPRLMIYLWTSLLSLRRYWRIRTNFDRSIIMICHTSAHPFVIFRDVATLVSPRMIGPFLFLMDILILFLPLVLLLICGLSIRCIRSLSSSCWSSWRSIPSARLELHRWGRYLSSLLFWCWQKWGEAVDSWWMLGYFQCLWSQVFCLVFMYSETSWDYLWIL